MDIKELMTKMGQFAAPLISTPNITPLDLVQIGVAFLVMAEYVFKAAGGAELAAKEFYVAADRNATAEAPR